MAKSKKKPATPAPRSSVAMAHSMRGGAGAGKHHTRTRDVETGRSRRPKHGGQRSLAERENPGYISFYSIEDTRDPFYRERVKATREAIDFIMDKGLASEMQTEEEGAPSPTTTVLAIDFEVPRMDGSAEVINSLMTATIDGRPLTHPTRR